MADDGSPVRLKPGTRFAAGLVAHARLVLDILSIKFFVRFLGRDGELLDSYLFRILSSLLPTSTDPADALDRFLASKSRRRSLFASR